MKKIRVLMEYKCYPVWLYDDEGNIEGTRLPPELLGDRGLDEKFMSIQERFDATYVDTPMEFYGRGFDTGGGSRLLGRPEGGRCGACREVP